MNFISLIKKGMFRELRIISNDRNLISVLLIGPIFYAFFYTSIYFYKGESNIPLAVVDYDKSNLTATIIKNLDQHQKLQVTNEIEDFLSAKELLSSLKVNAVIVFPLHFEQDIKKDNQGTVQLFVNNSRFLVSNDINKAVTDVILNESNLIKSKYFSKKGFVKSEAVKLSEPINIDTRSMFNITETYGDFLIPAILMLIIHQTLMIGLAESIAMENEKKLWKDLRNEFGGNIFSFILGKIAFYFLLYLSYSVLFFLLIMNLNSIPVTGNLPSFLLVSSLAIFSVCFFSIFVSSFFNQKISALQILTLLSYPIFLLSGFSWPIESMPFTLQYFSRLIPFTDYSSALSKIIRAGCSFADVIPEILGLTFLSTLYGLFAFMRIKYLMTSKNIFQTNQLTINGESHETLN